MQRTGAMVSPANVLRSVPLVVVLLCLANYGCNSCYSGFWNGNGSGVAVSNTSCPLTKATGVVFVQMSVASALPAVSAAFPSPLASPRGVQHIFVTLRGIEAHPNTMADEDSTGWEELAPDLVAHPMQLDLLAPNGDSRSRGLPGSADVPATVPADGYRQVRLRLVSLHPSADDLVPESNACGNVGWNCIVFADRSVRPLEFDSAVPEFRITQERGTDSVFRVLPDEAIHLSIEFGAASFVLFASNTAVRLVPAFSVVSRTASPDNAQ
jgi:hypothetical protein